MKIREKTRKTKQKYAVSKFLMRQTLGACGFRAEIFG